MNIGSLLTSFFLQPVIRCVVSFSPLKKNKFFCISMSGNSYGDNVKCLSDYISSNFPNAQIVWAFSKNYLNEVECEHKKVVISSVSYFYHILTSKYVISNFAMDFRTFSKKRKGQVCLQTWHGTTLKKIGYDMYKTDNNIAYSLFGIDRIKNMNIITDYFISGSSYMTRIFRERFKYTGKIYEIGTPRNDIFFTENADIVEKVKQKYGIGNKKIILYAPTFRKGGLFTYYDINLSLVKQTLEEKMKCSYVVLVRLHPNIATKSEAFVKLFECETIDVSNYPDMQELLCATDVLITDYSSSMFDFMYTYKPVIMYVPDRQTYNRGFYLDIDKLPFIIINNNNEIMKAISGYDADKYHTGVDAFLIEIGSVEDGNATKRAYNLLME